MSYVNPRVWSLEPSEPPTIHGLERGVMALGARPVLVLVNPDLEFETRRNLDELGWSEVTVTTVPEMSNTMWIMLGNKNRTLVSEGSGVWEPPARAQARKVLRNVIKLNGG